MSADAAAELERLERELLRPEVRADRACVDALLDDDFLEIGASGAVFGKAEALEALPEERGVAFGAGTMRVHFVTAEVARVNYAAVRRIEGDERRSLRSSWWRRDADGHWRMVFHQGMPETGAGTI